MGVQRPVLLAHRLPTRRRPRPSLLVEGHEHGAAERGQLQRSLAEVFAGRTVICISHRISSVRDCDQIIVLEGGRISERGSHRELLLAGGFYARTARQQALEEELDGMGAVA